MCEVIDSYYIFLIESKLPHFFILVEVQLILNGDIVLFHGFFMCVVSFPDFAVAIIEYGVVFIFWEERG